jgi:hypothetical protein
MSGLVWLSAARWPGADAAPSFEVQQRATVSLAGEQLTVNGNKAQLRQPKD